MATKVMKQVTKHPYKKISHTHITPETMTPTHCQVFQRCILEKRQKIMCFKLQCNLQECRSVHFKGFILSRKFEITGSKQESE